MAKFFTVEFTYDDEATPREPQYSTVKADNAEAARDIVQIKNILSGDRVNVGKVTTSSWDC